MSEDLSGIKEFCKRAFGSSIVSDVRLLSGGASMESWVFSCEGQEMVLRRMPKGAALEEDARLAGAIPLPLQADIIEDCSKSGIKVPKIVATLEPGDNLGVGFVMEKVSGEALPNKLLKEDRYSGALKQLTAQLAKTLSQIHNVSVDGLPDSLPRTGPKQALSNLDDVYQGLGTQIPVFEFAFGWLTRNLPGFSANHLVHGDFRLGNLLITEEGLSSVLDWELAHLGDPMRDIAFICTPSWRFGRYELEAGGFDRANNWIAAYEDASGRKIDRDHFRWWMVFNTLWWGVSCLMMGNAYRDGSVRTLERTIIGRRVSEVELDLLLQFEEMRPRASGSLDWREPHLETQSKEIGFEDIVTAISDWNRETVMPTVKGHDLFSSRMVGNGLGIVERHIAWGSAFQHHQKERLAAINLTVAEFCDTLRDAHDLINDDRQWDHLRLTALERVTIDQPKYAGLKVAKEKWIAS